MHTEDGITAFDSSTVGTDVRKNLLARLHGRPELTGRVTRKVNSLKHVYGEEGLPLHVDNFWRLYVIQNVKDCALDHPHGPGTWRPAE